MTDMSDENRTGGAADVLWKAWTSGERIAALPDEVRRALRARLQEAVRPYETPDGLVFPGVTLLATGRRP
jgi:hypothetical protein